MHALELNRLAAVGNQRSVDTYRLSDAIWLNCPVSELQNGTRDGFHYHDNFMGTYVQAANVAASATTLGSPWAAFTNATAASTIASGVSPSDAVGTMVLALTTANEGMSIGLMTAYGTAAPIDALSATNRVWFETRIKTSTITTEDVGFYVGLAQVTRLVTLGLIATGGAAAAAIDQIGWIYKTAATTAVTSTIGNGTATTVNASAATVAADTYVNLGFTWDGPTNLAKWYFNGTADSTTANLSTTQFPAGASLAFYMGAQCGSTAGDSIVTVDKVRVAFERIAL